MKKLFALVLVLAICCSALYSCNPSDTAGKTPNGGPCVAKGDHSDTDENGICDKCAADVVVTLDIYAINDLHGKIFDTDSQIGVDELTTYLRAASTRDEEHLLLSSGDMWQGSAESNVTKGLLVTDWMSSLGFASMTLGNHEYDWGEEYVETNAEAADFPLLAINVYDVETGKRVDYCDASAVVERGDLKIGIIGAIGDCYSSISSEMVEGVYFKVGGELRDLVIAEAERLRTEEEVDYVIYSIHDGHTSNGSGSISTNALTSYYARELSRDGYVDVVFEAHTHQKYVYLDEYGIYHLQNGGENKYGISHVEVNVNFVTDKSTVEVAEILSTSAYSGLEDDPIVGELRAKYSDEIGDAFGVLGYNSVYRDSEYIEELTARLYYQLGVEKWGGEYDIVLGGGFLRARSPYCIPHGDVTYSDLMMVMPFDNRIDLCSIKGSDLRRKFFETNNDDYHIYYEAYGKEVWDSIDPNATYYVIVDSYTSQYAYNNLTVIESYDNYTFARDLLAEYIRSGGLE